MTVYQTRVLVAAMAILKIFSLIGCSAAQEAPAPAPASSGGVALPSFALAIASFVFCYALRI